MSIPHLLSYSLIPGFGIDRWREELHTWRCRNFSLGILIFEPKQKVKDFASMTHYSRCACPKAALPNLWACYPQVQQIKTVGVYKKTRCEVLITKYCKFSFTHKQLLWHPPVSGWPSCRLKHLKSTSLLRSCKPGLLKSGSGSTSQCFRMFKALYPHRSLELRNIWKDQTCV